MWHQHECAWPRKTLNTRAPDHRTLVAATTAGGPESSQATLKAGVPLSQTTLTSGNRTEAPTPTPRESQSTARHGTQRARHPADQAKGTGQRTRAQTPHHHAGTASRGSHREHGDGPKRTEGALPPTGVYIRSAQEKLKRQPTGTAMYKMTGRAYNAGSREGQGMLYQFSKLFSPPGHAPARGRPSCAKARPAMSGAVHQQSMPCRPNATGTTGTDPKRPSRPNTSNSRTSRPLGGEDNGQPTEPAKHGAGNIATTSHADTPQTDEPRQNTPYGKETA